MSQQAWLDFLDAHNAVLLQDEVANFGDIADELRAAREGNIICDLSHLGLISVCGEEASDFLQNQFSNDIKLVNDTHSQLSAYCSAKGRVISLFRILYRDNCYFLRLPRERVAATINRLRMFILMTQATVDDTSDKWVCMGISGPDATEILEKQGLSVPKESEQVITDNNITINKLPGPHNRFEITSTVEQLQSIWVSSSADATPAGADAWRWLDIDSGTPSVFDATSEAFVPQMMNLQSLDGISFTKGCYPGQEVVARVHYLGKQKRRMYRAHTDSDVAPKIGDNIIIAADNGDNNQAIGKIVNISPDVEGGYELLSVLQINSAEKETLQVENLPNGQLLLKELPYTVEVEGS